MVTLITEKLQNQSLDDLTCKACEAGPYSAEKLSKSGHLFPLEVSVDRSPWKAFHTGRPVGSQVAVGPVCPFLPGPCGGAHTGGLQWRPESPGPCAGLGVGSALDLSENTGPPAAPPTKRHCRSLSEPEELVRCRSPWRPSGSRVWTPVSKRRCNSGGSATLQRCGPGSSAPPRSPGAGLPRSPVLPTDPTSPLAPRPASASSGFVDSSEGSSGSGLPWCAAGPCPLSSRRRLSLSQEHLVDVGTRLPSASSTPTSTPELGRRHGLLRCRSQPCVLSGRRSRRKRRREEDARWTRPSLDLLKMTRDLEENLEQPGAPHSGCQRTCPGNAHSQCLWRRREEEEDFKKLKEPLLPGLRGRRRGRRPGEDRRVLPVWLSGPRGQRHSRLQPQGSRALPRQLLGLQGARGWCGRGREQRGPQ
ncbi:protein FAM53A isoform X2 [Sciurus carolinensis]|uniref:protein FAM53A isoform X2 n=1 Tax=Sciurus carolinensis TaxID=30640 RepID=UPI001FB40CA3|nr:protein FAM53A isoform X2 [Sciurus carolinensis]